MGRRNARKNAFYLLFQLDFVPKEEYESVKEIFFQEKETPIIEIEKEFLLNLVNGVLNHVEEIDELITKSAKDWTTERMSKVELTIFRLAVYELNFDKKTPVGVVINEAIELSKTFSTEEGPAFVNGVLGNVARTI